MVQSIATFMDACYIARRNVITAPALKRFRENVEKFYQLWNIFIDTGVRDSISLPRQHALKHFYHSIHLFGSPNGLCSSITESKHIKAVKEPWRRSSRYQALIQMLWVITRMEKMSALRRILSDRNLLIGTMSPAPRPTAWTDGAWVRWGANRSPDADRWFAMTRYSRFVT